MPDSQISSQTSSQTTGALSNINRDLEEKVAQKRAQELSMSYIDVGRFPVNPDILHILTEADARRGNLMPFFKNGKNLRIAVSDPGKSETQEAIKKLEEKGFTVKLDLASQASITESFRYYSSDQYKLKEEVKNIVGEGEIHYEKELENLAKLKEKITTLPSEEALNTLHVSAIKAGASDIHYQPEEGSCLVRFRIDGILHTVFELPKDVYSNLTNQLKYKAKMKLNITTVPQDGRFQFTVNDQKIDVRIASLPTEYGEAFVCRILHADRQFGSFEELGFTGRSLEILNRAITLSQGMALVTGPTSSGKTTTLYVLLNFYNRPEVNIVTLEDPIEYHLKGITQSQVNEKRGYSFADGLRSIVRQDPDVVMIGEIRDLDTAQAALQAALTGHLLISTLHTSSAVDAIPRLITMGLPPSIVAPALSIVIAQRLVRRICQKCETARPILQREKELLLKSLLQIRSVDANAFTSEMPAVIRHGKGCEQCNFTGFRGQLTVSEALFVDDSFKEAILKNTSTGELFAQARKKGMLTMMEDGILKVISGLTTLDEIHRVLNVYE